MVGDNFIVHMFPSFPPFLDVTRRVITLLSGGGLSINGKHIYCGDYIFSGHTMTLTMAYLTITQCKWELMRFTNLKLKFILKLSLHLDIALLAKLENVKQKVEHEHATFNESNVFNTLLGKTSAFF